jgi:hypothetical protein
MVDVAELPENLKQEKLSFQGGGYRYYGKGSDSARNKTRRDSFYSKRNWNSRRRSNFGSGTLPHKPQFPRGGPFRVVFL